jgi:proteasome assembly chaperone (PAC2) family protein
VPSAAHVLYIPGILLIGFALGFVYGAKAARAELERKEKLRKR